MRSLKTNLALIYLLLVVFAAAQVLPTWTRNQHIDAGESKPINFGVQTRLAGASFNYNQHFNKTNFTVVPRVFLGQLAFSFQTNGTNNQSMMGYNITMGSVNNLNFNFQVTTLGVTIFGLHFIYLAVSTIYDGIYNMQNYYIGFSASDSVLNISDGSSRTTIVTLNNPQGFTASSDFSNSEIVLQTWILSYHFTPSGFLSLNTSSSKLSSSTFQLSVTVDSGMTLSELGITAIMINSTMLLEYSYTQYLDLTFVSIIGSSEIIPISTTISDFNTEYFYRNTLTGNTGTNIAISALTFFYYNFTSSPTSISSGYSLGERSRVCPGTQPYFFHENKTCVTACPYYYFSNVTYTVCVACYYSCMNCSNQADSNACTLCDASQYRQLTNSSCTCMAHYFENGTLLCADCHSSCLTCQNETFDGCLSCNGSLNRQLVGGECPCITGFVYNSSSLCEVQAICGDGVVGPGEECDDGNQVNGDGCSSACLIEIGHSCINNVSVSSNSVCYFSDQIGMGLQYVYKVPLENRVVLTISISAPNMNGDSLSEYLKTNPISFLNIPSRMLSVSSLNSQSSSYSSESSQMQVSFDYSGDIDLTNVNIQFLPSLSTSSNTRYFYATPKVAVGLSAPNNKLLTTFIDNSQSNQLQILAYVFLALVVASWVFFFFGLFFNQTAIAVEFILVVQVTYQSLLQSKFIYQGWSGLILFGKYTYGYNLSGLTPASQDTLTTLDLTIPLLNTLNITSGLILLSTAVLVAIFLFETYSFYSSKAREQDQLSIMDKGSQSKMNTARSQPDQGKQSFGFTAKRWLTVFCIELALSLIFLSSKITLISLIVSIRQSYSILSSLLPALITIGCSVALWLFYLFSYDLDYLKQLSFRRMLRDLRPEDQESDCSLKVANFIVKYHYLLLYVSLLGFAVANAASNFGSGLYLAVAVCCILWFGVVFINGNYLRMIHTARSGINTLALVVTMILQLLQALNISNPSQNKTPAIIAVTTLFAALLVNMGVFVTVQYKRRKNKKSNKISNQNQIVITNINQTEVPVNPQHHQTELERQIVFDRTHIELNFKDKSQDQRRSEAESRQLTQKKLIREDRDLEATKQKKRPNADGDIVAEFDKTRPMGKLQFEVLDEFIVGEKAETGKNGGFEQL